MNPFLQTLSVGGARPRRHSHGEFNDIASYLSFAVTERPAGRSRNPHKRNAAAALLAATVLGIGILLVALAAKAWLGGAVLDFRL